MGVHVFPILNPPPTFLPVPSLWVISVHQPRASCILHRTWTDDSFHIWYYTCFSAIPLNRPTLSISHRVQKTVLYICVSFAVLHTGFIITIFLNSIYMCCCCCCCCWVPSVMSDSVRPHRQQPTRLPVPGILRARTLEWVVISFSNAWKWKVKMKSLSLDWPPATPWTAAYQGPLSMGFSRQQYWSGVPLPSF